MCEILAVNAAQPIDAAPHLREFFPDSVWHPNGWGLAWREGSVVRLFKEPVRAIDSELLPRLLDGEIEASLLVAHIRNATRGAMTFENCHPFVLADVTGHTWVIAHNGTVLSDALVEPYRGDQQGDTDSERVALFLVDRINRTTARKGGALDASERFSALDEAMVDLAPGNKLNLVVDDGELTYAHTNTDQPTLYELRSPGLTLLCTRPLGNGAWAPVPGCQLVAYRDGELALAGTSHGQSFDNDLYASIIARERAAQSRS